MYSGWAIIIFSLISLLSPIRLVSRRPPITQQINSIMICVHCVHINTVYTIYCTLVYSCTVYDVRYTMYSIHCTLYSVQCIKEIGAVIDLLHNRKTWPSLYYDIWPVSNLYWPSHELFTRDHTRSHTYTRTYTYEHTHTYTHIYIKTHMECSVCVYTCASMYSVCVYMCVIVCLCVCM